MRAMVFPLVLGICPLGASANTAPTPVINSAAMRPGTTLMDVVYQVNDPDDATVKVAALAFIDGTRSFAKVIKPVTLVEGTAVNLGNAITTNTPHPLTWDVAADWSIDVGQLKVEVLCLDQRALVQTDWITIPAAGGQPALTISKDAPSNSTVLNGLLWRYANGDTGISLSNGVLRATPASGLFNGVLLAQGDTPIGYAVPYLLREMNLDVATSAEINYAHVTARAGLLNTTAWHAANRPFGGMTCLVGWGTNSDGLCTVPAGLVSIAAIAAGYSVNAALRNDGTVVSWGPWATGQPAGLNGVTAIAAGAEFVLALKSDGSVVGWGANNYWQATPPALTGATAIAAGWAHGLAVKSDGTVAAWGYDANYQIAVPQGLTGVVTVAAGWAHSLARKADGTVVGWGNNSWGQLNQPAGLGGVTAVSAGWLHSLALKSDGTVVAWGDNAEGQCNVPAGLTGVTAIAAGRLHSMALKNDGTVVAWGRNTNGQATVPAGLTGITAISAGSGHSLALKPKAP